MNIQSPGGGGGVKGTDEHTESGGGGVKGTDEHTESGGGGGGERY